MLNYGLEKEFFLTHRETHIPIMPESLKLNLPIDSCGYLVEVRGDYSPNIYSSVFSLKAKEQEIVDKLLNTEYELSSEPVLKLSEEFLHSVSRRYSKGVTKYNNYLGFLNNNLRENERTAGLHLSVTDMHGYNHHYNNAAGSGFEVKHYNQNFDYIRLFMILDKEFSNEIKVAKRNKGFYEVKSDGRIEYRSLPINIDMNKLINIIKTYK